jgi:hypothetical protein
VMQRADPSGCHGLESGIRVIGVRTVWGGADRKGLDDTVPRQLPTLLLKPVGTELGGTPCPWRGEVQMIRDW